MADLTITVHDPVTGEVSTATIEPGNYLIICTDPCHLYHEQHHANGTTVLTIKGRATHLMGTRQVGHG